MNDLSLVPDDELVKELQSRYDEIVVAVRRERINGGLTDRISWYNGDVDVCIGLCYGLSKKLFEDNWDIK